MSHEEKKKDEKSQNAISLDYCPHCGKKIEPNKTYCPNCGKLAVRVKPSSQQKAQISRTGSKIGDDFTRKCPGCGSIITSKVLEQCPICNSILPKIPEHLMKKPQPKPGFIFTDKKLEPESKFYLKKDIWNLREGARIVEVCVSLRILIYLIIAFQLTLFDLTSSIPAIFLIYLGILPELLYGIYPLGYIQSHKHDFKKLGFTKDKKKLVIAVIIGLVGGFGLLFLNMFSGIILDIVNEFGWGFTDIDALLEEQYQIIRNAAIGWKLLLILLIGINSMFSEILFRGVLHNTLKVKFADGLYGKFIVILIVALVYSLINLLLTFPIGLFFILLDFIAFVFLGILYEINENIYNTIFAYVFYNIVVLIMLML